MIIPGLKQSFCAFGTEIVVAGIAMPDAVIVNGLALGAAIAGIAVAVVLALHFLHLGGLTFSSMILIMLCLWLQIRQSEHCLKVQDLHSRAAFRPHSSQISSVGSVIFSSFFI